MWFNIIPNLNLTIILQPLFLRNYIRLSRIWYFKILHRRIIVRIFFARQVIFWFFSGFKDRPISHPTFDLSLFDIFTFRFERYFTLFCIKLSRLILVSPERCSSMRILLYRRFIIILAHSFGQTYSYSLRKTGTYYTLIILLSGIFLRVLSTHDATLYKGNSFAFFTFDVCHFSRPPHIKPNKDVIL